MSGAGPRRGVRLLVFVAALSMSGEMARGQGGVAPVNDASNPYQRVENHLKLAEGRWWTSSSAVDIDIDGTSVWVAERCAANSCAGSKLNPILKFTASGDLKKRFGAEMFDFPHGIHVDRDGNVWVTDADGPDGKDPKKDGKGHAVYKFSPDGQVLLTLGKPGVAGDGTGALLNAPSDVVTAPNGDIFVADGHDSEQRHAPATVARVVKFARDGRFIKAWGRLGSKPGEFNTPHGLALDSRGRLLVADRGNNRIAIMDQDGKFLGEWKQFGRPSGVYVDKNDVLYVGDSESNGTTNPGWRRGIRIGSARDGQVTHFIPESSSQPAARGGPEGVAVDAQGRIYAAQVQADTYTLVMYVRAGESGGVGQGLAQDSDGTLQPR